MGGKKLDPSILQHVPDNFVNPFIHRINLSLVDKIQIAVMSVTIVPIRIVMMCVCLILLWIAASIELLGYSKRMDKPMTGWRACWKKVVLALIRAVLFSCGYHRIRVVGAPKTGDSALASIVIAAPHSSFFDAVVMFACRNSKSTFSLPSGISRIENDVIPMLGSIVRATQPVYVMRDDPDSRQKTIAELRRRVVSPEPWPQIVVFPEGTCSSYTCLITFKPGAFLPGQPVQPIVIKQKNRMNTTIWTWDGPGAYKVLWLTLCQFKTSTTLEMLPVYVPSEEEKADPKLYAYNVRAQMAKCLGVPTTDHSFEDCRLMLYASKLRMPSVPVLVELQKLTTRLKITYNDLKKSVKSLSELTKCQSHSGGLFSLEELAQCLKLSVTDDLNKLFNLFDWAGTGLFDMREFIINLNIISRPTTTEDTLRLMFQLYSDDDKSLLAASVLQANLSHIFGIKHHNGAKLYSGINLSTDGRISYNAFKCWAHNEPDYRRLFMTYKELIATKDAAVEEEAHHGDTKEITKDKSL